MAKKKLNAGELPSVFDMVQKIDTTAEIIADSAYSNIRDWIPTGIYVLNACMSGDLFGAIPCGRVTTFYGPSSVGKSYLACSCAREAQIKGYTVIYMDSEGAIDSKFVSRLGVDASKLIIKQVTTIAETTQFIANICKSLQEQEDEYGSHQKVMFVLDSLGNLTSDKERDDAISGNNKRDMTKAQEIKAMFRVNATAMAKLGIPIIVNNHSYAMIGSYVPTQVMAGGCLAKGFYVRTKENDLTVIEEIKEGMHVLSADGEYHEVLKTWVFEKHTYKVEFSDNVDYLICSDNHRFLINCDNTELDSSWKTVAELNEGDTVYTLGNKAITVVKKTVNSEKETVYDLTVADTANYVTANGVINHNSGLTYNSSVTIELSSSKLEDKANDNAAKETKGAENATKNGVLVKAKPVKSRFCRPIKVAFSIPYFKSPNPYVGLEQFMNWENSGVCRGNIITEKEYNKMSDSEKSRIHVFEFEGETRYCQEKDTARGIVVKHLGRQVSFIDFFSDMVFTPEFLEELNKNVIHPIFDLPDQSAFDDIKDVEESMGIESEEDETDPIAELNV